MLKQFCSFMEKFCIEKMFINIEWCIAFPEKKLVCIDTNVLYAFSNLSLSTWLCRSSQGTLQRMVVLVLEACGFTYTIHTEFQSPVQNYRILVFSIIIRGNAVQMPDCFIKIEILVFNEENRLGILLKTLLLCDFFHLSPPGDWFIYGLCVYSRLLYTLHIPLLLVPLVFGIRVSILINSPECKTELNDHKRCWKCLPLFWLHESVFLIVFKGHI